jgi:uncharacterized cupredoxin-like copper-binding protein
MRRDRGFPARPASGASPSLITAAVAFAAITAMIFLLRPPAIHAAEQPVSAAATTVRVDGGEFFLRLSTRSAVKPGTVTFVFKNTGSVSHDFKINGKVTPLLQPGKTARLVVAFKKKGTYGYLCTVPGHAAAGMKGIFTVR